MIVNDISQVDLPGARTSSRYPSDIFGLGTMNMMNMPMRIPSSPPEALFGLGQENNEMIKKYIHHLLPIGAGTLAAIFIFRSIAREPKTFWKVIGWIAGLSGAASAGLSLLKLMEK